MIPEFLTWATEYIRVYLLKWKKKNLQGECQNSFHTHEVWTTGYWPPGGTQRTVWAADLYLGVISVKMEFKTTRRVKSPREAVQTKRSKAQTELGGIPAFRGQAKPGRQQKGMSKTGLWDQRKLLDPITEDLHALSKNGFSETVRNGSQSWVV